MLTGGQLLGRGREVAAINAVVAAGHERASTLVIIGDPGIGKSALLATVRAAAAQAGFTVLRAAGNESEMQLPFGGLHQALAPLLRHLPRLPVTQREALATALGLAEGARPELFLIAEAAVALLICERGERPVMVVVDDLHWLDPQSHQILMFVAHRGGRAGICVVGALRPDHGGPFAEAGFPQLWLAGVDDATADELLRVHGGPLGAAEQRRIRREAQGNPLALLELPRSWGGGPETDEHPVAVSARLVQAFAGRVAELPQRTRDALLVAAVNSSGDARETLAAVAVFAGSEVSEAILRPAVSAGLITDEPVQLRFRHPLVRAGVLQLETLARRHGAHAALAEVLVTDPYRRTWHRAWSIVGPDDEVADALAATAADSLRRGAVMSAVPSLERSAQLTSSAQRRGERLLQAAGYAFGAGRADVVARILREAADIDVSDLDAARAIWLAEALNDDVRADSALVRTLCRAAGRAHGLGDRELALNLLAAAALRCWWADSGAADRAAVVEVLDELVDAHGDLRHVAALAIAEPVLRASEVMGILGSIDLDQIRAGDALRLAGMAAYGVGDLVMATDLLDRAEAAFRTEGRLGMLPVVLALQLHIRLDLGDWSGADAAGLEVVTVSRETGQTVFADNNVLVEARGLALRGDGQAALDFMAAAESSAARARINDRICLSYQARGAALLSADRPVEAFECLRRQYDSSDPGYHLRESFAGVALLAEAAVACGRTAEARVVVQALATVAVITPSPLLEVNLLYATAVLAPEAERESRYRAALAHDLSRWPWLRARLQLAYGQWLAGTARPAAARVQLQAAGAVFARIGAARWRRSVARAVEGLDGATD